MKSLTEYGRASTPKYGLIKVFDALTVIGPLVEVNTNYTIIPFEMSTVFDKNTTILYKKCNDPINRIVISV